MPRIVFAPAIQRHLPIPPQEVVATTVHEALEAAFGSQPMLRGYILDDQGTLRRHVAVFVDGAALRDRRRLGDALGPASEVYVVQALSGG
ncbi:ubiquitin family protein [Pseudothauera rhizosphaerae]|uniref:MoaD/ThiS family protein n=1 Tax=Pseudothauera rhizosphaerae TaxID=2565932 RepID=A0A4S4AL41_9RHOO|nr:MoaD/ThiS family protein [Pseudothauera rhizosphaerae]THF60193.1 MoaD/ThiS family protein [Pseudothauera rhizosphaerae]